MTKVFSETLLLFRMMLYLCVLSVCGLGMVNVMERETWERAKRSLISRIILISTVIEVARSTFFFL